MNQEIEKLRSEILSCKKCDLSKTRNHVIFGEGSSSAGIMVIGEAPCRDEDIQGRPFVGKSGELLDNIVNACGFTRREHIFISNIYSKLINKMNICSFYLLSLLYEAINKFRFFKKTD